MRYASSALRHKNCPAPTPQGSTLSSLSRRPLLLRGSKTDLQRRPVLDTQYHEYHGECTHSPFTRSIFLKTALKLAERGIPTFPLKGKQPLTPHGFKDASTDLSK